MIEGSRKGPEMRYDWGIGLNPAAQVHVVLLGLVLTSSSESGKTQKLQSLIRTVL